MSRSWAFGVALLVLALPSCKRSSRGGNGERHAARGDGGVLHGEGQLRLPGPRRARVLALAPGQNELALVVWQDTEGIWASTATTSQRIGEPDPEAVAAWDGHRVHVLGTLARRVPDNSFMDGGRLVVGFDMDAWRIMALPDGRPLLVWLDLVAPDVQQEPPRELRGVQWRVLEALPR